jgi:hypothetical protein
MEYQIKDKVEAIELQKANKKEINYMAKNKVWIIINKNGKSIERYIIGKEWMLKIKNSFTYRARLVALAINMRCYL